ncbi:unnamed protein product [Thlaspi arvense]|uniref:Uncharacterized protein n=1 Tax=Thlaspi arvense TaxID=13288 RepID=A0AAU9S9V1_THLAR|nr:unnamed protein product [Thlaspi arvense]
MGVSVLHPRDYLNDLLSNNSLNHPHRQKKPVPNRCRRSPPRRQSTSSPPPVSAFIPNGSKKKNLNHINNHVRILKRGEEIGDKIPDLGVEKPDLKPTRQIRSDLMKILTQIRTSDRKSMPALFYAGPVTSTSPPPSDVPLPAFFAKKSVSVFKPADATNDLIRIMRLDIA